MAYGILKVDTVTFTNAGVDKSITLSGLVQNPTFSGNVTVTGTLSGVTVTGTTANFTSGNFTNISGGTHTITSGVFAAGSAANPSITFTGDLNTGIYSPGADQVAISTNGSGRLFVDASGRLGVGTSSPVSTLSIRNDSLGSGGLTETAIALTYSSTNYGQHFIDANGTYNIYANNNGVAGGNLQLRADTGLIFNTASNERLRITSAGLVGIGTSAPDYLLTVGSGSGVSASPTAIRLDNTFTGSPATKDKLKFYLYKDANESYGLTVGDAGDLQYWAGGSSNGIHRWFTSGSERLRITSAGLVGVGTSSPSDPLHIAVSGANSANIRLQSGDGRTYNVGSTGSGYGSSGKFIIYDITAGAERFCINSSGSVGIGTTSPASKLSVSDSGAVQIQATTGTVDFRIQSIDANSAAYSGTVSNHAYVLTTNNAERARIDSSGRLLVGTSSQSGGALLQVNGDRVRIATAKTPASATDTGTAGEICWDASYVYVCTATNTWKRSALSTW